MKENVMIREEGSTIQQVSILVLTIDGKILLIPHLFGIFIILTPKLLKQSKSPILFTD